MSSSSSKHYAPNYTAHVPWLEGRGRNDYSQFGEDGLIEACLERFPIKFKRCFEVGAADGFFFSNTARLRELGWSAVLIEADDRWGEVEGITRQKLTPANFNDWISGSFDLGVIDVDGQDYWLFDAMECRPHVMLVEFSPYRTDDYIPPLDVEGRLEQATLGPIVNLGRSKGYEHVATTYCNALFVGM